MSPILLLVHAAATWYLVGLIWFVQRVHYPLIGPVPKDEHVRRTTPVVAAVMIVELGCAVWIAAARGGVAAWAGLALLGVVWASTVWVQVPLHRRLQEGAGDEVVDRLVAGNWIRTIAWSARGVLALGMVAP